MEKTLEERYAMKFCVKLNKTPKDTYDMLKEASRYVCMSYSQTMKWHKSLRKGREDVNEEARSGPPSTSRTDEHGTQVGEFLYTDRRMSVRMISEQLNLPKTIIHEIISEELAMWKICAKLAPKLKQEGIHAGMTSAHNNMEAIVPTFGQIVGPGKTLENHNDGNRNGLRRTNMTDFKNI
ncbi:hypothetical protein NQ318_012711 [Aromia moschata]|uniref:FLJ37770-like protein n=1 Tax=Aromia moschata TaxID=1265417 RepID=A0AAV8Y2V8_9CUCU|nr:hypothetical protein NQ318_012711 [Aromia moschata]